jgi:hypothetical protein
LDSGSSISHAAKMERRKIGVGSRIEKRFSVVM